MVDIHTKYNAWKNKNAERMNRDKITDKITQTLSISCLQWEKKESWSRLIDYNELFYKIDDLSTSSTLYRTHVNNLYSTNLFYLLPHDTYAISQCNTRMANSMWLNWKLTPEPWQALQSLLQLIDCSSQKLLVESHIHNILASLQLQYRSNIW